MSDHRKPVDERFETASNIIIAGGGFIGLEMAEGLANAAENMLDGRFQPIDADGFAEK